MELVKKQARFMFQLAGRDLDAFTERARKLAVGLTVALDVVLLWLLLGWIF